MTAPPRSKSPWEIVSHKLGLRRTSLSNSIYYDPNVRYVLEDIAIQLGRIADALESNKND